MTERLADNDGCIIDPNFVPPEPIDHIAEMPFVGTDEEGRRCPSCGHAPHGSRRCGHWKIPTDGRTDCDCRVQTADHLVGTRTSYYDPILTERGKQHIRDVISRITYKPGWTFYVVDFKDAYVMIEAHHTEPDSRTGTEIPEFPRRIPVIWPHYTVTDDQSVAAWVRHCIHEWECHEAEFEWMAAPPCRHDLQPNPIGVTGHGAQGHEYRRPGVPVADQAARRAAMGIDWMNRDELAQAIPPAYTEWIGRQLLKTIEVAA